MRWTRFAIITAVTQAYVTNAAFSFGGKRFKGEGLLNAGRLGLNDGKVGAWGDADNDQFTDAFVISDDGSQVSVRLWDHGSFSFRQAGSQQILEAPVGSTIRNIVPSDFNHDGILDLLMMSVPSKSKSPVGELELTLFLGTGGGNFDNRAKVLPSASSVQPMVIDGTGNLAMDLLGHIASEDTHLKLWRNTVGDSANSTEEAFVVEDVALVDSNGIEIKSSCKLTEPHSSAFIDLDGDCSADLFLVCQGSSMTAPRYEIWTALPHGTSASNKDKPSKAAFQLSRKGDLPSGVGMLSFADLDRDGTIDVILPSCEGNRCFINIADNEQMPLCTTKPADWTLPWLTKKPPAAVEDEHLANITARQWPSFLMDQGKCREPSNLCTADPDFKFDFDAHLRRFDVKDVLGKDWRLLLTDNSVIPAQPIPFAVGDFNKDGYPDVLLVAANEKAGQSQAFLLQNTRCSKAPPGSPGCADDPDARTFVIAKGSESLSAATNVVGASFVDLDEDGTLDIMLQTLTRDRGQIKHDIVFIQNNLFYDSFFLKLQMLNGACERECEGGFRPWGVNYAGASYKFTVLDPNGIRRAQQVGQLAQTTYGILHTPSAYLGLGRTNNYVELLEVGSSRRQAHTVLSMEGVIPNSQIFINPWQPQRETTDGRGDPSTWTKEMYLHPGDWITWVTVVLVAITVVLAGIVFLLHMHERREDEKERKRAVYAINFDAL